MYREGGRRSVKQLNTEITGGALGKRKSERV